MPTHATKISLLTCVLVLAARIASAQLPDGTSAAPPAISSPAPTVSSSAPSPPSGAATTNAAPAVPAPAGATAPTDNVSSALDYLFNRKPQDGSAAQAAGEVAGNMGDKMKAADVLGVNRNTLWVIEQCARSGAILVAGRAGARQGRHR